MDCIGSGGPGGAGRRELLAVVDNQHPWGWGLRLQLRDYEVRSGMCGRRWSKDERRTWLGSVKDLLGMGTTWQI